MTRHDDEPDQQANSRLEVLSPDTAAPAARVHTCQRLSCRAGLA